ncbi:hypothetical protein Leryth_001006 [Lithospermum erythrorhizon]|nr:hypothetical protein Leryth_001006 [Lithospermum erythrorhizon]
MFITWVMQEKMTTMSSHICENLCREIHADSCGELNKLGLFQELVSLSPVECRKIRQVYMQMYREDLYNNFKNVGNLGKVDDEKQDGSSSNSWAEVGLSMLMLNPHERDAVVTREALERNDVKYNVLVEIFTCRKSSHFLLIQQAYQSRFQRHLDQDILKIEPPSPYQKLLIALSASHKAHKVELSQHIAKCDARRLFEAGEGGAGQVDEAVMLEILSKRSIAQTKLAFSSYKHIYGHSFTSLLRKRKCREFEDAVLAVVRCISSPTKYFAEVLNGSLKSGDKEALVRIMVSRAEVDMEDIRKEFENKYSLDLKSAISECPGIPQGNYKNLLLSLLENTH